jgi:predicted nucleotidyltransferase
MGAKDPSQPPTLERLRQLAPELLRLTAAHGGQDLRVFGSVIYGAAGRQSDVDLLVDFPSSPSFEQYMDLKLALEDLLNVRVDLVTRRGLRPELRQTFPQLVAVCPVSIRLTGGANLVDR